MTMAVLGCRKYSVRRGCAAAEAWWGWTEGSDEEPFFFLLLANVLAALAESGAATLTAMNCAA